jgi:circadian clock protein KaiB
MGAFRFTLFVAGPSTRSERAIANLKRICEQELNGSYQLEIVDVLKQPARAEELKILTTPTLIKQEPPPVRRIIGDLSDAGQLIEILAIDAPGVSGGQSP